MAEEGIPEGTVDAALIRGLERLTDTAGKILRWVIVASFGAGVFFATVSLQLRWFGDDVSDLKETLSEDVLVRLRTLETSQAVGVLPLAHERIRELEQWRYTVEERIPDVR